jgi:hypothetical protein
VAKALIFRILPPDSKSGDSQRRHVSANCGNATSSGCCDEFASAFSVASFGIHAAAQCPR